MSTSAVSNSMEKGPMLARMLSWLSGPEVVGVDGSVVSWVNASHPGYAYPEAGAWLLDLIARRQLLLKEGSGGDQWEALRARIAAWLLSEAAANGGAGRGGHRYVFDTAIVLEALLSHSEANGELPAPDLLALLFDFVCEALGRRAGAVPSADGTGVPRWSLSYGSHLLRVLPVLLRYAEAGRMPAQEIGVQLLDDLLPLARSGRFVTHHGSRLCYTHAHCYAVEGLLGLLQAGVAAPLQPADVCGRLNSVVTEAAGWLGRIQRADGGIPAAHDGAGAAGESRADSTAQAIRIWAAVGSPQFAPQIAAGLRFLAGLQQPCGGLAYSPTILDTNTWATVFAADALLALQAAGG